MQQMRMGGPPQQGMAKLDQRMRVRQSGWGQLVLVGYVLACGGFSSGQKEPHSTVLKDQIEMGPQSGSSCSKLNCGEVSLLHVEPVRCT